jgi:polysaccharide biosynthesis/export protein
MRATVKHIQKAQSCKILTIPITLVRHRLVLTSDFNRLRRALQPVGFAAAILAATLSTTPGQAQTPVAPSTLPMPSASPLPSSPPAPPISPATPPPATPLTPSRLNVPRAEVPTTGYQEEEYRLGPGDQIGLDIFDVPELSGAQGQHVVLVDGSVNLPWVGKLKLQGLTLSEASDRLEQAYTPYIRNPLITVNLVTARTLRVDVVGAVKRPGSYIISPQGQTNQVLVGDAAAGGGGVANQWPTVTQALQQAGGITQLANLREVQVNRPQPDGSQQTIKVNLWELLRSGQIQQDIALRDRDTLVVPQSVSLNAEEALLNGSSSFSPATILVNVVGEVKTPGTVEVAPNTSLNQALLTAGGFESSRARRKDVILIRLNPDGTAVRRTIPIDLTAGINEETNPSLREFDTIVVGRSGIAQTGDTLDTFFRPLGNIFGIFNVFNNLFN